MILKGILSLNYKKSSHDGPLREYPFITVDRFHGQTGILTGFITHAHTDHLIGLEAFNKPLYCTKETKCILSRIKKYSHLKETMVKKTNWFMFKFPLIQNFISVHPSLYSDKFMKHGFKCFWIILKIVLFFCY